MDVNEFNRRKIREGSLVEITQKPEDQLKSPGVLPKEIIGKPAVGYISGGGQCGYSAHLYWEMFLDGGFSAQIGVQDIAKLKVYRTNHQGRVLRIEIYDHADGRKAEKFVR